MRYLFATVTMLFTALAWADIPSTFGGLRFGMADVEVSSVIGREIDFRGQCASCPSGTNEVNLGAVQFIQLAAAFPGMSPDDWKPESSVTLLTTHAKLTGIIFHSRQTSSELRSILEKALGKPNQSQRGLVKWRDRNTVVQADYEYKTVRVFYRHAYPNE